MTTYLDYKVVPLENDGPPPVGAPENMPTNQVNNVMREIMSVVRQLGDKGQADIDGLGTMATQDADAVVITGGTVDANHSGSGAGLTDLPAQELVGGPIPKEVFPADAAPLDVKVARAGQADTLAPGGALALLPIGMVMLWFGASDAVPAGWHICDGTGGTPDLRGRMVLGAGPANPLNSQGGAWQSAVATDAQGAHSHGGGTAGFALAEAHIPPHVHQQMTGYPGSGGPYRVTQFDTGPNLQGTGINTAAAGGGAAHAHAIGADGAHAHNVTVPTIPVYTALWYIMKVA